MIIIAAIYLAIGIFWAGVSFGTAWYERCHQKHSSLEWVFLFLMSFLLWPTVAAGFFIYSSGPGCGGSGVRK